jgi:glucosamine--fructose-6-phosphate aminotransferase (isomerizing)
VRLPERASTPERTLVMRYLDAVRAQGRNLRAVRKAIAPQLAELDLTPWRGARLGLAGMGASYNAIVAALGSYWTAGLMAAPWHGSDLRRPGAWRNIDAAIAVSQTGRSAEMVSCLDALPTGQPKLALTDDAASPVATTCDSTVSLHLLEDSAVRTLGYTGTLQALGMLRDALTSGHRAPDWEWLADEMERLVPPSERLAERITAELRGVRSFDVVGSGAQFGSAAQAALLLREVARLPAAAYDTYEYLHGPLEAADAGLAMIAFGGARESKLAASLADAGATVILVTDEEALSGDRLAVFGLPKCDDVLRPVLEILPLQVMAFSLAQEKGLPEGEFRLHQDDTKVA